MKKYVLMTAAILALTVTGQTWAQTPPPAAAPPAPGMAMTGPENMPFPEHKAMIIDHLQKRLACVQASQNHDQLKACMPPPPAGGPPPVGGPAMGGAPQR